LIERSVHIKIPLDRIGVLIGPKGSVKRKIEETCGVTLQVSSETGDVTIIAKDESDPITLFRVQNVVTAVGRGFTPEKAFQLLDESMMFEVIDLRDCVGKSKSNLERIKGRIIGEQGKTRKIIEETTGANISVDGHTVSIIGEPDAFEVAKTAVQMLISGSQHSTVYRFLHRKRRELKKAKLKLWETP